MISPAMIFVITCLFNFVTEFTGIKSSIFNAIHIIDYLIKKLYQIQLGLFNKVNDLRHQHVVKPQKLPNGKSLIQKMSGVIK